MLKTWFNIIWSLRLVNKFKEFEKNVDQLESGIEQRITDIHSSMPVTNIILDCSCINNIDSQGVSAFLQVLFHLKKINLLIINIKSADCLVVWCI